LNRNILLAFKILLFLLLSWFIINQLFLKNDFKTQFAFCLQHLQGNKFWLFLLAIFLMPVNWGLETIKWKALLHSEVPLGGLLKSIIAGITVGFVTPGRSGEFAGRVMFLNDNNGAKVFYLSSIGGLAQTAASLVIGVPFVFIWSNDVFITEIITAAAAVYLLVFFRFDLLNRLLSSWSFLQKYGLVIEHGDLPVIGTQVYVLFLSAIRFTVYTLQYVLLLGFFGISTNTFELFTYSVVYLLAQTFSPLMPLLDFSYRGATALYVFKNLSNNNIAVLSTVMLVWLINLVVPAVIGYFFILKRKVVYLPRFRP
jgi:hypothetical protein